MKTLYFHVGAHRAASSFLQESLLLNRDTLAAHGLTYIHKYEFGREPAFTYVQNVGEKDLDRQVSFDDARSAWQARLEGASTPTVLASHENGLGRVFASGEPLYPVGDRLATALQQLTAPHDLRLIVVTRAQPDFIESFHAIRVMYGKAVDVPKYLAKMERTNVSWQHLLTRLAAVVGRERLSVMPFEAVFDGSEPFLRAVLGLTGTTVDGPVVLSKERNARLSQAAMQLHACAAQFLDEDDRKKLRFFLKDNVSSEKYGRASILDEAARQAMRARYADDNARMLETFVDPRFVTDAVRRAYCG